MEGDPPFIPNYTYEPQWRWQWWKFNLDPEILFTDLADKYNSVPCRIQCREAFHADVSSIIHQAENIDEFHRELALRRDARLKEIQGAWYNGTAIATYQPAIWEEKLDLFRAFLRLKSDMSFDNIVQFLHAHMPEKRRDSSLRMGTLDPASPFRRSALPAIPEQNPNGDQQPTLGPRQSPQSDRDPSQTPNPGDGAESDGLLVESELGTTLTTNAGVRRGRRPTSGQNQQKKTRPRKALESTRTSRRIAGLSPEPDTFHGKHV
ncbi:hypothetical protein ACKVWH_008848 [Pyricularia oryzae]